MVLPKAKLPVTPSLAPLVAPAPMSPEIVTPPVYLALATAFISRVARAPLALVPILPPIVVNP